MFFKEGKMTKKSIRRLGILFGIIAFALCFSGGLWILSDIGADLSEGFGIGLGLYFIAKAFFVGPMLIITSFQFRGG